MASSAFPDPRPLTPTPFSRARYAAMAMLVVLWLGAAAGRLFYLQVVRYTDFAARAQRQQQRTVEVSPRRGILYDRNFHELAMSIQVDSVFAAPGEIPQPEISAALLARVLDLDRVELLARMKASRHFCWVKRKVNPREADRVRALNLKGVYLEKESKRFYPKNELAAQVLGYVGLDENGLGGIEQEFDTAVRGRPGLLMVQTDARHRWFGRYEKPPDAGDNLVLTLDEKIQYIAERELAAAMAETRAEAGTVVVMNPNTGELLAVANRPTFNPNSYQQYTPQTWQDRAVSAAFEPGSTFKVITVSAALEERLTRPDEVIDCQMGAINVFGLRIRDHHPFGSLTVSEIITHSSDVGAVKLGLRVGPERLYRYMRAFGFGSPTGVELPGEARGLLRPVERWSKPSIGAISFGQEVGVTPLQMTAAISAIANGGILYRPRVVRERFRPGPAGGGPMLPFELPSVVSASTRRAAPPEGRRILSPETALEVHKMLERVVLEGTGRGARLNGYTSAGKTGTAQKVDPATRTYSKTKYVASYIGFAPSPNPAVAIAVILDSPAGLHQGGQVSAPVFKRIAEQVLAYLEVPHDLPTADNKPAPKVDPAQVEDFPMLEDEPESADPAGQNQLAPAATSVFYVEGISAPDFLGKSQRTVAEEALAQGLDVELVGTGVARQQAPAPGARLVPGRRITVRFGK